MRQGLRALRTIFQDWRFAVKGGTLHNGCVGDGLVWMESRNGMYFFFLL